MCEMKREKSREGNWFPRGKRWIVRDWVPLAASAVLGLMVSMVFFVPGLAYLKEGINDLGIVYMAVGAVFTPATMAAAWWTGRS